MAKTARAVIAHGQDFDIREYPVPDPEPNTILLRQELAGICGTDLHNWQNGIRGEMLLGHENVGIIESIGKGVTTDYLDNPISQGDRIVFAPGVKGGYGAYGFRQDADNPPHFSGGFAEPFAVGVHAVMRGDVQIGDTVVIQGSGAIGLVTLVGAKISGAAKLIMVGGPAGRLELAERMGADVTINIEDVTSAEARTELIKEHTPQKEGADVVFECAGFLSATPEGLGYVKFGGTFVEVGHFVDMGSIQLNPNQLLMRKNLRLEAVWGFQYEHFIRGLPILEKAEFPFADMISHVLPLSRVGEGFEALNGNYQLDDQTTIKIAIKSQS